MVCAYIGLGSNLAQPLEQVRRAIAELDQIPETRVLAHSRWYRSVAVGPGDQPDYINAVAELETDLEAHALLDQLQAIEQAHQRVRLERWGPRTLDLDLLLYGDDIIATERLTVPHAYLKERNFVLFPLADLARDLTLPSGESLESLLALSTSDGLEALED
ncbi:2-amino-4-hydroxy-6-hydroxymethyldihydropteridine diphosphokinase [Pseudomaricurvus alkylphenolicus]|jgi:2-amino-4-hydroxy-6-hydroxymethyldihydropteridine diphosphokinase|uniref:2-amino-4-hydroxy-6- hydroxymethyldihydropteridine diphosphokinase n=1 Tax=Pseudomaricurvus alkylphenolicus TaxID=1306991 RepID=UPI00142187AF|nr:2-amino-4-hydroxy-6-hydroxymethyldihydropteridine diphosphokinase [Pseudomaricurvus alkylphenolicus]NIB42898.1 2-amino-4-hydroxy-6-hydroxymethyldihydropteridine diphosphokinase [Pseudomaricurvus alkylphenolicus]